MYRLFFFVLGVFLPFLHHSQVVTVSEEIVLRAGISYELIGKVKGQYMLFQNKEVSFEVQCFDETLKSIWTKELELDKKRVNVIVVSPLEDHFYIVYEFKQKGNTIIKAQKYDARANLVDSVSIQDFGFLFLTPNFQFVRSEDHSKLLIWYVENESRIHALSFDINTMTLLWSTVITPQDYFIGRDFTDLLIDNKGQMHLIIQKDNLRYRGKVHYYEIYKCSTNGEGFRPKIVPMEGYTTYDAQYIYDNLNQQLVIAGLYSDKNTGWAKGYFVVTITEKNPDEHLLIFQEFEDKLVESYLESKTTIKNKGISESLVQEIILRRDGGVIMVIEKVKTNQRAYATGTAPPYNYRNTNFVASSVDYYYEHLMLISIHPEGEMQWNSILRKKQFSQDDGGVYSSYFLVKTPSNLRFVFNDEIKEENTVSEYIIQSSGDFGRRSVMSTDNQRIKLRFPDAIQVGIDEFVVPSERRGRLRIVRVKYV